MHGMHGGWPTEYARDRPPPRQQFFCITMLRQHSRYDCRLGFSFRVLVRVRVRLGLVLGLGLESVLGLWLGLGIWVRVRVMVCTPAAKHLCSYRESKTVCAISPILS